MSETRREVRLDVPLRDLSAIFLQRGWVYGNLGRFPMPQEINRILGGLIKSLDESGGTYGELGRFVVFKDAEFPNSYEICLKIGYATDYPVDMDKPEKKGGVSS